MHLLLTAIYLQNALTHLSQDLLFKLIQLEESEVL
jgi:hypothetical protein